MPKHDVFTFLYVVKMTFFTFWYSPVCRLSRHQRYACYSCCWRLSITLNDATSFQSINQSINQSIVMAPFIHPTQHRFKRDTLKYTVYRLYPIGLTEIAGVDIDGR